MKFIDLYSQYKSQKKEIDNAIKQVINRSDFIMGKAVFQLEEKLAKYNNVKYSIALNSGSDALFASLKALNIKKGDEVIVPAFTYIATAEVVALSGATPVFIDIDSRTFNIDINSIEKKITKNTKAIIPVHLYGQPADLDEIIAIAKKYKLFVVEDAAQAIGATYKGKKVGSFGDTGCLSFFPTKNLGAFGDGGMVLTNHEKIANYIKKWRIHGQSKKYFTDFIGDSSRLDTIQAAILLVKSKYLNKWIKERQKKADIYSTKIKNENVITPVLKEHRSHVYHQYTIRIKNNKRDKLQVYLKSKNIPTLVYYPLPLNMQKPYIKSNYNINNFPNTEKIYKEALSLPIYPELTKKNQDSIIQEINNFLTG